MNAISPLAKTIPESVFMIYQMTFAVITVALVAGSVADRMRFSAYLWFVAGWLLLVYVPIAHWVWGGGFLAAAGVLDFAGGTVVHLNAGIAGLVACYVLGKRRGYGTDNLAPYDLSLAVIGTGLLWVGWFGFNGGSALGANSRAGFAIAGDASRRLRRRAHLDGAGVVDRGKPSVLGMISGAVAGLGTITPASGFVLPWHGIVIGIVAGAVCYWACTRLKTRCSATTTRSTCSACTASAAPPARSWPACSRSRPSATPPGLIEGNGRQVLIQLYGVAVDAGLVGHRHLRAAQGDRLLPAAAGARGGRADRPRRLAARRIAAIARAVCSCRDRPWQALKRAICS